MILKCRASCGICDSNALDLGLAQAFNSDPAIQEQINNRMAQAQIYLETVATNNVLRIVLPGCKNHHPLCALWAIQGEVSRSYCIDSSALEYIHQQMMNVS